MQVHAQIHAWKLQLQIQVILQMQGDFIHGLSKLQHHNYFHNKLDVLQYHSLAVGLAVVFQSAQVDVHISHKQEAFRAMAYGLTIIL